MDHRSPYLHQNRSLPQPQTHPPAHPHHNFHTNPNFNGPHDSSLPAGASHLTSRPPPPPPPPTQFHLVPTQPPFNPRNSHFTYNPNQINYNHPRSHLDVPNFAQSPRLSHQKPFDDDLSRRFPDNMRKTRADMRQPSRVLSDRWPPERPYPSANLNTDSYRLQLVNQLLSPVKIRHGLEGNSRFVEDHNVGMEIRQGEEFLLRRGDDDYHRRSQFGSTSDRSSRDFYTATNQMNHGLAYENLRGLPYDDRVSGNQRWLYDREVSRDVHESFIDRGSHDVGSPERIQIVTGKREHYRGRESNAELERHTGKGSREGSYEYNRTPRKQPQKKSVLLRIQKPNYRNREEERGHCYFDDSKSSSFRGRDQNLYLDRGMEQKVREGSPVELDVSFKSNSLVAKAIVTPAPSSAVVSDSDSTPRNGKLKEVLVLNKDSSNSSLIKPSEHTVKLVSAISAANKTSNSDKGLEQLREEVSDSGIVNNTKYISSLPASCESKLSLGKSEMESSANGTESNKVEANVVSANTSSLKVGKKKKIVKRLFKKVVKKCEEPVILDSPAHGLSASSNPQKDDAAASVCIADSQAFSNDVYVMPNNDKVEDCAETMASEKGTSDGSGTLCVPNFKRKRSRSTSPMGASSHEEINTNENMINDNSANYMHTISNTDKDIKLPKETFSSSINAEDIHKQQCQNGVSLLLGNNKASGSLEELLPTDSNASLGFSSLEKIKIHKGPSSSCNTVLGYGSDYDSINSREGVTFSENGTTDVGCKQFFINRDGLSVEHGSLDEILNASCCVGNNNMVRQSDSGETTIQNVPIHAICTFEGVRTIFGSDSGHTTSGEINSSSNGTSIGKQSSLDSVSIPIQNISLGGSLHCITSTGGCEEDKSNIKKTDKNVEMTEVELSKSEVNDLYLEPVNMVRSDCWVDTTLRLSFKNSTVTEVAVSGDGSGDAGIQPCKDGVSVSPLGTSVDCSMAIVSPPKHKKLKLSGSQLKLSCATTSDFNEGPITSDVSVSSPETLSNYSSGPSRPETEATVSAIDPLCVSDFPPLLKDVSALPANCSGGGSHDTVASIRNAFDDDDDDLRRVHLCSTVEELSFQMVQSLHPSALEGEQIADVATVFAGISHGIHVENADGEKMDVDCTVEQAIIDNGASQCQFPSENQSLNSDERLLIMDGDSESCHLVKNDLSSLSNYLSSSRDGNGVSATNEVLGLSDMDYLVMSPDVLKTSDSQLSIENVGGDDDILGKLAIQGRSIMSPATSGPLNTEFTLNSYHAEENAHSFTGRTGSLPPLDSKECTQTLNAMSREIHGRKNQPSQAVSRISSGRSSLALSATKKAASSARISKPRTWHRTENSSASAMRGNKAVSFSVPTQRQLPKNVAKFRSTSYIRKGNSLVRKPTVVPAQSQGSHCLSSSIYWLNSLGTDEVKKNAGSENRTVIAEPPNFWRTSVNSSFQRPRTPPLPTLTETPNQATSSLGYYIASSSAEHLNNCADETSSDPVTCAECHDVLKSSEDAVRISENHEVEIGQINNLDCRSKVNDGNVNVVSSNVSSIRYVKRKSNQLVATSNPLSSSINNAQSTPTIPSDGYYKRRKNQLIRTSQESQFKLIACMPDGSVNSDEQTLDKNTSSRSLTKRRLCKVVTKACKPSKFSLVWTLRNAQLSNGDGDLFRCQKVLPYLFPWKRTTYWKNFMPNSAANSISGSSSTISRKLMLLRKRDTVYTRSKHGFSLRKSKVLSVGGSSLKWSKSIEKQSKKANEEATLAVAEAERKKRVESGASHVGPGTKNRNSSRKSVHNLKPHQGGRIFRIGSVRYKMDSSRRTLQRISDDESSFLIAPHTEKDAKRFYVPRRLVIGKDEYVRIGNGNQLVRDPKKRTRILASEKVRWSLHTARSRLARKRKYCQFFTRFGKCNKDDGKCPYIHDSSKIAVCTKFLNGLCFNSDCKLTHKVIPERMPDCSYFLQGICTNKNCSYRHVHVNPNASTCEGFLKGYCADGNECRKKHSYVCPTYEATGSCPQGSKCKLHHPKQRSKGKKSKQSREKKNVQGRYFGSMRMNVSEPGTAVSEKHSMLDNSNTCFEGSIADYISLDFNDEAGENSNPADEQTFFRDSDPLHFEPVDLDELIKPIRIMNS